MEMPLTVDQARALKLLDEVWGVSVPPAFLPSDLRFLSTRRRSYESLLETCARIAHVSVQGVVPLDYRTIHQLCADAVKPFPRTPYPARSDR